MSFCKKNISPFLFICLYLIPTSGRSDQKVPIDQALNVIRIHESNFITRVKNAQWSIKYIDGIIPNLENPSEIIDKKRDPKLFHNNIAYFIPENDFYRVDSKFVTRWIKGADDYLAGTINLSYDGKSERRFDRAQAGTQLPTPNSPVFGLGIIRHGNRVRFLDKEGSASGISYFPPNHFNRRFSEFLEERLAEKSPVNISSQADGTWLISTAPFQPALRGNDDFQIRYDPRRGLVLGADWIGKTSLRTKWAGKVWKKHFVDWRDLGQGIWVPASFTQSNLIDAMGSRWEYTNLKINQPIDEAVFRITFPVGTRLTDEIEKKEYTVSKGVIDEQEAIRSFMRGEKIREEFNKKKEKPWWQNTWLFGSLGGICFLVILVFFWRRIRLGSAGVATLLILVAGQSQTLAIEPDEQGSWRIQHPGGDSFTISQCGLNVTLTALEYFQVDYQLKWVSLGLPPTEEGIRFLDIKTMLEAYGLDVVARDKVTLSEMKRVLRPGTLAIFPIKVDGTKNNHYLIAMMHQKQGAVLLDPPHKVTLLANGITEEQFSSLGGLVLFVRLPKETPPSQSSLISITPAFQDLGTFHAGTVESSNPVKRTLVLENKSETPILIHNIRTACGCLQVLWKGGIILPKEKQPVPFFINPGGWGFGKRERTITFVFSDKSEGEAKVSATIAQPENIHKLSVHPDTIPLEIPYKLSINTYKITSNIILGSNRLKDVNIETTVPWISYQVKEVTSQEALLTVSVNTSKILNSIFPVTGEIKLTTQKPDFPVRLKIFLSRPVLCQIEPPLIQCKRGSETDVSFHHLDNSPIDWSKPGILFDKPRGVFLENSKDTNKARTISIRCSSDIQPGYYTLHYRFGNHVGDLAVSFTMQVQ